MSERGLAGRLAVLQRGGRGKSTRAPLRSLVRNILALADSLPVLLLLTRSWVLWDGGMEQPLLQEGLAEGKQAEYPLARVLGS